MVDPIPESSFPSNPDSKSPTREKDFLVVVDRALDPHLVVYHEPGSAVAEQYRTFRTNLVALNQERSPRALLLTSSERGEGKSLTAANLALALAELPDTRTLLVDADLREATQAELFSLSPNPGLSDILEHGLALDQAIVQTTVPNLSVLVAGRGVRNASELLGSQRMGDLVHVLKAEYNYILFDTPPVLGCVDATVLGIRVDGTLLVVRIARTRRELVERSLATMRAARNHVIGCFLAGSRAHGATSSEYVLED